MGTDLDPHCPLLRRLGSWPARPCPPSSSVVQNVVPADEPQIERGMFLAALPAGPSPQNHVRAPGLTDKRWTRRGARTQSLPTIPETIVAPTTTLDGAARKTRRLAPLSSSFTRTSTDQPAPSGSSGAASSSRRRLLPEADDDGGGSCCSSGVGVGGNSGSSIGRTHHSDASTKLDSELSNTRKRAVNGDLPRTYPFTGAVLTKSNSNGMGGFETATSQQQKGDFAFHRWAPPPSPPKRPRALHDVDGPGTGALSCKKRRLRLHLITSRLSLPYSLPATHILSWGPSSEEPTAGLAGTGGRRRGSSSSSWAQQPPAALSLSRLLRKLHAVNTAVKRAGHQTALVRKAAILNRVRINVRHAAVLRGHRYMAGLAERQNALNHGLLVVTAPDYAAATGAKFPPALDAGPAYHHPCLAAATAAGLPVVCRPRTTVPPVAVRTAPAWSMAAAPPHALFPPSPVRPLPLSTATDTKASATSPMRPPPAPRLGLGPASRHNPIFVSAAPPDPPMIPPPAPPTPPKSSMINAPVPGDNGGTDDDDDDDGAFAFPAPDLDTRYADLSDDDMDDVYADFGVLFGGGGSGSEDRVRKGDAGGERGGGGEGGSGDGERRGGGGTGEEHFYEEYLDELDGIPWIT